MPKTKTKITPKKGKIGTKIAEFNARMKNVERPTQKLIMRSNLSLTVTRKKNGKRL